MSFKYRILETKDTFSPQFKRDSPSEYDFGEMWSSIYPYNVKTLEEAKAIIEECKKRNEDNKVIKIHEA